MNPTPEVTSPPVATGAVDETAVPTMHEQSLRQIENMSEEDRALHAQEMKEIHDSLYNPSAPPIDVNTAKALQDNASWRMIEYLNKKSNLSNKDTVTFDVHARSTHGYDGTGDVLTVDMMRCLRAALGIDASSKLPSKHCYIRNIDIMHATNTFPTMDTSLRLKGDKLRGSCVCAVSEEHAGREHMEENHLMVIPAKSSLAHLPSVYTSRGFEKTDTFLKYGDALKYNIRGAVHTMIPTSASVDYISPFTLGDGELQSITTEDFSSIIADRQNNVEWKTNGDYFLHLLAKNYKTFEKSAAFMTRPSIVKGSQDIWALTYAKSDCDALCKSIDTKIMNELRSHIIDLDNPEERALKFEFASAHLDHMGNPEPLAKVADVDDHVGVLMKVTAVFV